MVIFYYSLKSISLPVWHLNQVDIIYVAVTNIARSIEKGRSQNINSLWCFKKLHVFQYQVTKGVIIMRFHWFKCCDWDSGHLHFLFLFGLLQRMMGELRNTRDNRLFQARLLIQATDHPFLSLVRWFSTKKTIRPLKLALYYNVSMLAYASSLVGGMYFQGRWSAQMG